MDYQNVRERKLGGNQVKSVIARLGVFIVFGVIIVLFAVGNERFLTPDNILLIIQQASPMGIAVIGMVFVMVVAGIDISVGSNMYFTAVLVAMMINNSVLVNDEMMKTGIGYIVVYLVAIAVGIGIGLLNGVLVAKFKILPFIVTLSVGSILRGLGYMMSGSLVQEASALSSFSNSRLGMIPAVFILFLVVILVFDFLLRRCVFGRHILAIGNSPKSAQVAGIKINRDVILCYVICAMLAAVSGVLQAGQIGSVALSFGDGNEFIVISAAVLGGTSLFGGKGTIFPGAIIGIILITIIMNGLAMLNASPYVYTIVRAVIIFLAVMLDSINYKGDLR